MGKTITITVYGAKQICASCIGAPGSLDTYEWLQAAIGRKYVTDNVEYQYVDMDAPTREHQAFVEQMISEDMLYPVVFVNEEMVAEGIPRLKPIYQALDKRGVEYLHSIEGAGQKRKPNG